MPLGGIFQTSNAFVQVQGSLSWIVDNYAKLTEWAATVERLARFNRSVEAAHALKDGASIVRGERDELKLTGVALMLPDGHSLLRGADLSIAGGDRVVLAGPSGSGKSTLLRAIAGIWPFGSGTIARPNAKWLFLPQRPYMPLGSLKRAACYPMLENEVSDDEVDAALRDAGLGHLASRMDEVDIWERRLSGGEQQRLALARALLIKPDWLFLDEATASLDPAAEEQFYKLLRERLPNATIVSIAHRPKVAEYHERTLRLERGALRPTSLLRNLPQNAVGEVEPMPPQP
jgi:putative ATP-binding cassette transporter